MENYLVSIIMAAKDTEPYISECLDSILAQTYTNWELLAVNDHSNDRTRDVLIEYSKKDSRIKVFDSPGNRLNPALKESFFQSKGQLINRMDSDDKMPPDKISLLVNKWMELGENHVISGGTEHFVDEGEVGGGFLRYEQWLNQISATGSYIENIYKECVIPSHSWLMHRSDLIKVGAFDPDVYPEDYDLCFRIYKNKIKIIGLNRVLHYWRDRSDRISRTWEEYKDNRYFDMKLGYFIELDRIKERPLILWGAGRNGKDMAKKLMERNIEFYWVCDNQKKIGKNVYNQEIFSIEKVSKLNDPQIIIVVSSPSESQKIKSYLIEKRKQPVKDFWFFV